MNKENAKKLVENFNATNNVTVKVVSSKIQTSAENGYEHIIINESLSPKMVNYFKELGYKVSEIVGMRWRISWEY